jgi:shikimate dehydrogenase
MKKYLVIGRPIEHSLSPELHNFWIKKNNINAIYEKKELNENELENLILQVKQKKINGLNVTVPFKKKIIPFLDKVTAESKATGSVNTIYLSNNKVTGHNTDIEGFKISIEKSEFDPSGKKVLILGAGGVVSSIIYALNLMRVSKIIVSNRTKTKTEELKNLFKNLDIVEWGELPDFDMIVNATSLGLKKDDKIDHNFSSIGKNKFFYDVIYNPKETNFLRTGKNLGNKSLNGKLMFIYQAFMAFNIWHGLKPEINEDVMKLLD